MALVGSQWHYFTDPSFRPAHGSQPGAQAGRHALEGQEKGRVETLLAILRLHTAADGSRWQFSAKGAQPSRLARCNRQRILQVDAYDTKLTLHCLLVGHGVVSSATSRSGARWQDFIAPPLGPARFSTRCPRRLARPRRAWERGDVRDLKIGPVIHPTSTRQWLKASPRRHGLDILGTAQRRPETTH
jgi:hypothetical protein